MATSIGPIAWPQRITWSLTVQATMIAPVSSRNVWLFAAAASFFFVFLSVTTTSRQSWRFLADGACRAASRTTANLFGSKGLS